MSRPYRSITSPPKPQPVPLPLLFDRALVGAFAALVVARPLLPGDDPGRLRLTSSGGPVSFTLCLFFVFVGFAIWRLLFGRGRPTRWPLAPLLLAAVGIAAFASSQLGDRYGRPGLFVAWEWIGLAVATYLTRRLATSVNDSRGLLNVLVASAVSIGALAIYQSAADHLAFPSADAVIPVESVALAGDDEFNPELNGPVGPLKQPHGTFDSPETLLVFVFLFLPVAVAYAKFRRQSVWGKWVVAVPLMLILAGAIALLAKPFGKEAGHWSAAVNLIAGHPFLGIGPGNFSRLAPEVLTPHSAWLALAATTGLVGLVIFATAIGIAIWRAKPATDSDAAEPPPPGSRWEFYFGGMAGLVLGFVWAIGAMPAEAPAEEVFRMGAFAIGRAVLWFATFALLETVRPTRAALGRAILVGAGIVLIYGLVFDTSGRSTILFPLFVMLALAANLCSVNASILPEGKWTKPVRVVRVIAACGVVITHLVTAGLPAWGTYDAVRQARMASRLYPDRHREIERARPGAERATALTKARGFLLQNILTPLREASNREPSNSALLLELARWRRPLWEYQLVADPENAARVADDIRSAAERADKLDPNNPAAQRSLFEALALFRKNSSTRATERINQLNKRIELIARREPALEVPLRFRVVQMLLDVREREEIAKPELVRLLELDREEGHGHLTIEQKRELIDKAKAAMTDPPKILLDEWTR
jgi:hypothetical protein